MENRNVSIRHSQGRAIRISKTEANISKINTLFQNITNMQPYGQLFQPNDNV